MADTPTDLLPCPFCGNPDIEYDIIVIECGNCGAGGGPRRAIGEDGVLTSEELWNKRRWRSSAPQEPDDALRAVATTCDLTGTRTGRYRIFRGKKCLGDVDNKLLADLIIDRLQAKAPETGEPQ